MGQSLNELVLAQKHGRQTLHLTWYYLTQQ